MISNYIHTTFPSSPLSSFIHVSCLFGFRVYSVTNQKTLFFFRIEVQVVKRKYEVRDQHLFKKNQLHTSLWAKKVNIVFALCLLEFCTKFVYLCILLLLK